MSTVKDRRRQTAVLPVRLHGAGHLEIMLLTSRETRRWVIPKGWPMKGRTLADAALEEAFEEAGLEGELAARSRLGRYKYLKRGPDGEASEISVDVFVMAVTAQAASWKEQRQRETRWFAIDAAASLVAEPGLAKIIRKLPTLLRRKAFNAGAAG